VKQFIQKTGIWIVGMRMIARNFNTSWLVVSLILLVISKAGAAEITLTNANNSAINSTINTNAFNSTKGLTNTITWTNTTTAWTNFFAAPAGGAPNFNGINWGSSESVNGLVIGGTYAATNVGTLVGANPFVNVGSATGLIKVNGSFAGTNGLTKTGAGQLNLQSSFNTSKIINIIHDKLNKITEYIHISKKIESILVPWSPLSFNNNAVDHSTHLTATSVMDIFGLNRFV
jgi:hypothetical protein